MIIDIHSHQRDHAANIKKHFNIIIPQEETEAIVLNLDVVYSAGIHPWYIAEAGFADQLGWLRQLAKNNQVRMIGECGIDKLKGPSLNIQEEVFIRQIRTAEEFRKPVIIHCVRAFNEMISIKKVVRPKVPLIIHGFQKKPELGLQLIEKGFYLSLGADLLRDDSQAGQLLKQMDLSRLFLETDDSDADIVAIYQKASEILEMPVSELQDLIYENYLGLYIE
jgi:TatD DNase family protein